MNSEDLGVVLYTDGSSRPNPGKIGWGCHGYTFKYNPKVKPIVVENRLVSNKGYVTLKNLVKDSYLYNDFESLDINAIKAVEPIEAFDFLGSSLHIGTNNKAEILALYHSLNKITEYNPKQISVFTDSEYLKKGINEWCKIWERNGWVKPDGVPVINSDEWKQLYQLIKTVKSNNIEFTVDWVRAHGTNLGNIVSDILSVIGMNYSTGGIQRNDYIFKPFKDYWKIKIEKHPFINFKRLYFNTIERFNILGQYFQVDPGCADLIIGKRIPETGFAIVKLKNPDNAIESVKQKQYEIANDQNSIVMMKLDKVYSKEVFRYLEAHGKYCLIDSKNNLNVTFIDKKSVTVEMNPAGLSMRVIDAFNFLEDLLENFIKLKSETSDRAKLHDVTDIFFNKEVNKKGNAVKTVLKNDINIGMEKFTVTIEEQYNRENKKIPIPLILGIDLLPRNNLKRLEDLNPKIYIITWREFEDCLRYAVVIECDDGVGIWSNFFSDRIYLAGLK